MNMMQQEIDEVSHRFHVALDPRGRAAPAWMTGTRTRRMLSKLFDHWPQPGCIGLPVAPERRAEALSAGVGEMLDAGGRLFCERRQVVQPHLQPFAPFVGRRHVEPIVVQTPPRASRAATLETFLTPSSWRDLADDAIASTGGVCELCGAAQEPLEIHELWEYRSPRNAAVEGVMRLKRMLCLCRSCHEVFHPVMAEVRGTIDRVIERYAAANEFTIDEARDAYAWDAAANRARTEIDWVMDLSVLDARMVIEVDSSWSIQQDTWRLVPDRSQPGLGERNTTLPLGVRFVLAGESYERIDPSEHYVVLDA